MGCLDNGLTVIDPLSPSRYCPQIGFFFTSEAVARTIKVLRSDTMAVVPLHDHFGAPFIAVR